MQLSRFEIIREENLHKLISDFYEGIKSDTIIRQMYPDDLAPAQERLFLFMMQFLGGPKIYHQQRGLPALKRRHVPFPINQEARDRWMDHMLAAIEKNKMPDSEKEYLKEYFGGTATFLLNR